MEGSRQAGAQRSKSLDRMQAWREDPVPLATAREHKEREHNEREHKERGQARTDHTDTTGHKGTAA